MSAVRSPYTRGEWFYQATRHRPDKDHVFSEMDEEKHSQLRSKMSAGVCNLMTVSTEAFS